MAKKIVPTLEQTRCLQILKYAQSCEVLLISKKPEVPIYFSLYLPDAASGAPTACYSKGPRAKVPQTYTKDPSTKLRR